jgi:hypothetical protein
MYVHRIYLPTTRESTIEEKCEGNDSLYLQVHQTPETIYYLNAAADSPIWTTIRLFVLVFRGCCIFLFQYLLCGGW